jgi:hypothetical protein
LGLCVFAFYHRLSIGVKILAKLRDSVGLQHKTKSPFCASRALWRLPFMSLFMGPLSHGLGKGDYPRWVRFAGQKRGVPTAKKALYRPGKSGFGTKKAEMQK